MLLGLETQKIETVGTVQDSPFKQEYTNINNKKYKSKIPYRLCKEIGSQTTKCLKTTVLPT